MATEPELVEGILCWCGAKEIMAICVPCLQRRLNSSREGNDIRDESTISFGSSTVYSNVAFFIKTVLRYIYALLCLTSPRGGALFRLRDEDQGKRWRPRSCHEFYDANFNPSFRVPSFTAGSVRNVGRSVVALTASNN